MNITPEGSDRKWVHLPLAPRKLIRGVSKFRQGYRCYRRRNSNSMAEAGTFSQELARLRLEVGLPKIALDYESQVVQRYCRSLGIGGSELARLAIRASR